MSTAREALIRSLYAAFNDRRVEDVLAWLAPDVEWPNAWEGGVLHGQGAVRDYWHRQWREIEGHVEPTAIRELADGRIAVDVHQVVRDPAGELISEGDVVHTYEFTGRLIRRMEVTS